MIKYIEDLCDKYPIISVEDGLAEEDWDNYDRYVNYFQDFIVKEIDIHLWDWGTRKKIE